MQLTKNKKLISKKKIRIFFLLQVEQHQFQLQQLILNKVVYIHLLFENNLIDMNQLQDKYQHLINDYNMMMEDDYQRFYNQYYHENPMDHQYHNMKTKYFNIKKKFKNDY
jgi:hypothetical protein